MLCIDTSTCVLALCFRSMGPRDGSGAWMPRATSTTTTRPRHGPLRAWGFQGFCETLISGSVGFRGLKGVLGGMALAVRACSVPLGSMRGHGRDDVGCARSGGRVMGQHMTKKRRHSWSLRVINFNLKVWNQWQFDRHSRSPCAPAPALDTGRFEDLCSRSSEICSRCLDV